MGFILIATLFASAYLLLQLFYLYHWKCTSEINVPGDFIPTSSMTIVVVARNEEKSIERCIRGILEQHYPENLFEVIVVNDRSTDDTVEIIHKIQHPNFRLLNLHEFPDSIHVPAFKKSAIELAIGKAQHDWIVVSDADCLHPVEWLRTIAYTQSLIDAVFLTGPVRISSSNSIIEKMQEMELQVLMLITAAGIRSGLHDMANGANMAFSKQAFNDVGGYSGNYEYASGDDMFLVEKMRSAFPEKISFIKSKSAIVETSAQPNWNSLLKQRLRWAGKNKGLKSPVINMIWSFIGLYHILVILMIVLPFFTSCSWWPFIILILIKWVADFIISKSVSGFLGSLKNLSLFIPLQILYGYYVIQLGWNLIFARKADW